MKIWKISDIIDPKKRNEILFILIFSIMCLWGEQINIPRVEAMPNFPQPYKMRNWKQVTMGYDSLVFDLNKTGQYLPLVWIDGNSSNYPNHNRFGLNTAIGNDGSEAINVLPALVSASLVDIDKSDQNGYNWVLMSEEFFNKRDAENIYLNNYTATSGSDWWYDTMPNIYFYMLYDIYGKIGDYENQFTKVADQWLEAVCAMEGSTTPWTNPYMNYRAWIMSAMQPLSSGVKQPEASGAIAWILYHAYKETNDKKYRIGAELSLDFLNAWESNPAYELQLPFGVYTAARMNAEMGTDYDVEKLLNWCFTSDGNVRNWGACLGNWGGYDCDGLIGEAKYDGYAFFMNGADQFGALVPMVRYDNRFARSIGKWALNVANASRLFYTGFLPDENQDGEAWAREYDPKSYIAHEAIREYGLNTGISPFATGDFIRSGWGPSNYVLYGSSHVGMFGGIIDTTNIEAILQLDLLKTDFFEENAYPSYLYYNPHDEAKTVEIEVGWTVVDLYDAVANEIIASGVSGIGSFSIPADEARIIVVIPNGTQLKYDQERTLVGDIVIDYSSGNAVDNFSPRIKSLSSKKSIIKTNESLNIYTTAMDKDNDNLNYRWIVENDTIDETENILNWKSSDTGLFLIKSLVSDGQGGTAEDSLEIEVVEYQNHDPVINKIKTDKSKVDLLGKATVTCSAKDEDGDSISYLWSCKAGKMETLDSILTWTAPDTEGNYQIVCKVSDEFGGSAIDSLEILVREGAGDDIDPIVYLPFDGNADDISGNEYHGSVSGAELTSDHEGTENAAFYFDGIDDCITVADNSHLNFQDAIAVALWLYPTKLYDREAFPISHGSWENRWKISIIPEHKIRWTIKTTSGTKDLDSKTYLNENNWYHIVAIFDGETMEVYINGELESHTEFSGELMATDIDLTIGQMLPSNNSYNYQGKIDDVRIYDSAISETQITRIYSGITGIEDYSDVNIPDCFSLRQNYPNPFNPVTTIAYDLPKSQSVTLEIYDILGHRVKELVSEYQSAGNHEVKWNSVNQSSGLYFYKLKTDNFVAMKKCLKLK